ncbi:MAG TPA: hypothetical protein VGT44_04070, partial [Ktedonobacteraceae bacterium]|nr:hypothetical protein [Ktedonobacteraceae bacterium]
MWMQMIQSQQLVYSLLARPAILFLIVAAISYLWVNSALNALKRADRAELIAELERRELEQKQELERAIEHILLVQTRVANGDFDARVPIYEHHVLWQVSIAFNNLLARFKSSAQSERNLHRVAEEIAQLRSALKLWQLGQPLRWYPTEKNLLGPLADDLRRTMLPQVAASAAPQGVQAAAQMPHANQGDIRYRSPMTDPGEPAQHIRYRSPVTEPGEPVEQASPPHAYQRPWPRMA